MSPTRKFLATLYQLTIAAFIVFKIYCAGYGVSHNKKFEDVILAAAYLMFTVAASLLNLFYTSRGKQLIELSENLDQLCTKISNSPQSDTFEKLYLSDSRLLSTVLKIIVAGSLVCPAFFSFSVPVSGLIMGNYGQRMAHPTHCPCEAAYPQLYMLFVLMEFMGVVLPALQRLSNEFLMLGLLKTQAAFFKYLAVSMKQIGDSAQVVSQAESKQSILRWVKLHQPVIRNAHDLISFFSPVVIIYYFSIICIVAGGSFYQLNAADANVGSAWGLGIYVLMTILQMHIQCQVAEELTSQAENLAMEVYSIPWYLLDSECKGFLKLVINMANRPIRLMAFKAVSFTLNKESFVGFMTNSISAYMGFSKIMQINQ